MLLAGNVLFTAHKMRFQSRPHDPREVDRSMVTLEQVPT